MRSRKQKTYSIAVVPVGEWSPARHTHFEESIRSSRDAFAFECVSPSKVSLTVSPDAVTWSATTTTPTKRAAQRPPLRVEYFVVDPNNEGQVKVREVAIVELPSKSNKTTYRVAIDPMSEAMQQVIESESKETITDERTLTSWDAKNPLNRQLAHSKSQNTVHGINADAEIRNAITKILMADENAPARIIDFMVKSAQKYNDVDLLAAIKKIVDLAGPEKIAAIADLAVSKKFHWEHNTAYGLAHLHGMSLFAPKNWQDFNTITHDWLAAADVGHVLFIYNPENKFWEARLVLDENKNQEIFSIEDKFNYENVLRRAAYKNNQSRAKEALARFLKEDPIFKNSEKIKINDTQVLENLHTGNCDANQSKKWLEALPKELLAEKQAERVVMTNTTTRISGTYVGVNAEVHYTVAKEKKLVGMRSKFKGFQETGQMRKGGSTAVKRALTFFQQYQDKENCSTMSAQQFHDISKTL